VNNKAESQEDDQAQKASTSLVVKVATCFELDKINTQKETQIKIHPNTNWLKRPSK
jgi:hypothetical protein